MSIQPIFNYYKTVPYVCSYLSETECSPAIIQAVIQAFKKELENYEQMKFIAKINGNAVSNKLCIIFYKLKSN